MIRRILKYAGKSLLVLTTVILIYVLAAWILGQWRIQGSSSINTNAANIEIYLMSNGIHTDIVMPLQHPVFDWHKVVQPEHTRQGDVGADYVAIGWGDKGFYLNTPRWRDLTASTALRAVSGFNETALHVAFLPRPSGDSNTVKITINESQYRHLVHNIAADFQILNQQSRPIAHAHYADNDAFYEAHGRYSLFYTCNTWSNQKLKNSGIGGVVWTPFSGSLMERFRHH